MRKIRVICSDPYATDYSSDDEDSIGANEPTIGKLFVHEISLSRPTSDSGTFSVLMAQKSHSDASDSSRKDGPAKDGPICIYQENDGSVSENNGNLNRAKYPGLRMTASGKWGVQLSHPFKVWCGSYNTIEEAINGCKKKKIELAMLRGLIVKNDVLEEKHMANHRRQKLVVDDMTVLETVSGKWAAWIRKKASNAKTWLGLYATREEAMESYSRMKLKLDSNCNLKSPGKGSSSVQGNPQDAVVNDTAQDIASPTDTDVASFRRPGMKLTRKGKWGVRIQHPKMDSRQWLGSYDTLEEAAEVYDKKKIELEESCIAEKEIPARGASTEVIDSQGHRVRYKGVRLRTSGRWSAETRDPRKRRKVHLGTYDTPEEAAAVYNKHRRQLEARICQGKTRSLKDIAEAETVTLPSETVAVIPEAVVIDAVVKTEPNNASPALTLEAENSTVTAVSGQDSEGSNTNNDNQIPSSSLEDEDELGLGVINCHGQYVGEYSKMDDELLII